MTEPTPHLGDEIQDLLDGRLDPAREAVVRTHLATCDACRAEWQRLDWLKTRLRAMSAQARVPADVETAIHAALARERRDESTRLGSRDESTETPAAARRRAWRAPSTLAAGMAALVAIAIIGGGLWWWFRPPTPADIATDYRAVATATLALEYATPDARTLARQFAARGGVPAAVYDLGMMQYQLAGGRVHADRGRPRTIAVYRGARGEPLICEMYFATPPSRPPIERRTHNGVDFAVYRDGDVIMVFWREGTVTCVLASAIDPETLIQLAFAKAGRRS